MFLFIPSPLTNGSVAQAVSDARLEALFLAMFGVSLIMLAKLVRWLSIRNRAASSLGLNNSEMINAQTAAVMNAVETKPSQPPLGWDRPLVEGSSPSVPLQPWPPRKPLPDLNVALR